MYTEASSPAKKGDKASLTSREFPHVHSRCMTFFFSMNAQYTGALRVFLVNSKTKTETKLWEKHGKQGENWEEGEVDISSEESYKVRKWLKCRNR